MDTRFFVNNDTSTLHEPVFFHKFKPIFHYDYLLQIPISSTDSIIHTHLLRQIPIAFFKLRLCDSVLGQEQFPRLNLTAVQFFVR